MPINVPTTAPTRDPDLGLAVSGNHVQCIHITYISLHKHTAPARDPDPGLAVTGSI